MCVRYNVNTNICSEVEFMERVTESTSNLFMNFLDNYQTVRNRPHFKVYPQMPVNQIKQFIKQATYRNLDIAIQLNPSPFSDNPSEIFGKISISPHSGHIILSPKDGNTYHLIQQAHIRHIRII